MSPSQGLRLPTGQSHLFVDPPVIEDRYGERPPSPAAPPYSPITPVMTSTDLASSHGQYPHRPPDDFPSPPPPVPFSENDNPDAMALRSAITILQIQRQQSQRDMRTLEEQKKAALADPIGFANAVAAGDVRTTRSGGSVLGPDLDSHWEDPANTVQDNHSTGEDRDDHSMQSVTKFGDLPGPQNVVRCPPINWAKYHIAGDALDKLHEEQKRRPDPGHPHTDREPTTVPEHVVAAPYNPWTDRLPESSMRTRSVAKKDG